MKKKVISIKNISFQLKKDDDDDDDQFWTPIWCQLMAIKIACTVTLSESGGLFFDVSFLFID